MRMCKYVYHNTYKAQSCFLRGGATTYNVQHTHDATHTQYAWAHTHNTKYKSAHTITAAVPQCKAFKHKYQITSEWFGVLEDPAARQVISRISLL